MSATMNPLKRGSSRVFTIEGRARGDHVPVFRSCLRAGGMDRGYGDVTDIECPSPDAYGDYVIIGEIQGAKARATSDLLGHYALDEESYLQRLAERRCSLDYQVHYGECTDPSDFNTFKKAKIYENVRITNYSTDEEGSLASGDEAVVDETAAVSAREVYEVLPLSFVERGGAAVVNPIVDVVICDTPSCGDCEAESDGCEKIYAVDDGSTGSPGTAPDVVYSVDKGVNWAAEDVDSLAAAEPATAIACISIYVVVSSNVDGGLHYKQKTLIGDGATNWTRIATGIAVGGEPNDMWGVGSYLFVVGDGGYVYGTDDITAGVTVLDAGIATTDILYAVHALNDQFAVAVGASDTIIFTQTQNTWGAATATGGGGDLLCVWAKNENEWWVGDDNGDVWYTLDQGVTWTEKVLPGTGWTAINDIQFPKDSVGYIVGEKSGTPRGYGLQSFDGGYSWILLPQLTTGSMPNSDSLDALATCSEDANFVVMVGLGDDALDGIIIIGQD